MIKNLNTKPQSLRLYMLLLKFTDYFLFSDDLKYLPRIIRGRNKAFFEYLIEKLSLVYPESKALEVFKNKEYDFIPMKEISEITGIKLSRLKKIFFQANLSFEKLGIVQKVGEYCKLNPKFFG